MHRPPAARSKADRDRGIALALVGQLQPALQRGDRALIVDLIRRLVALRAPLGSQWRSLAQIVAGKGELTLARKAIDLFVEASGKSQTAQYQKAVLLAQHDAWHDAYKLIRTLSPDVPDPAANAYSRGMMLLNLGNTEEGREHLERVVAQRPQLGSPWLMLALSAHLGEETELADRIVGAESGIANAPAAERAPYYYALGKVFDQRGEHARAFAAFERGAREMKSTLRYSRDADRTLAADAIDGYNPDRLGSLAGNQKEQTSRTIFVTGLPRSGTTLVQQILTSHSAVSGGAEIGRLGLLGMDAGGVSYGALSAFAQKEGLRPIARLWRHWLKERFPAPGRVVDKTPDASRLLGFAASLLPEAPLIWMTRDPLDRAWSCFRTNFFAGAIPWSYDLRDIAFHFALEDQLLARWQQILEDRLLIVPYEALVADPGPWIRRILAHCSLAEEPQVFAPHENRRPVATSSMMQVRRPINRDGIGAAGPYRAYLAPFLEAYQT
jgi:tetratricopeptide (TPR) repeat protein